MTTTKTIERGVRDKRGKPFELGQTIKVFHFIGARRKRHFMYKVVVSKYGRLAAMDIYELATLGFEKAHSCSLAALPLDTEIVAGGYNHD